MYGFILFQSPEFDLDGLVIEDPVEDLSSNGHAPYVPAISWQSVLWVEETRENHRPVASH
jgi:hypothetical protein